eukprot:jgi/Tetstr1/437951/TSEL_026581.t1
MADPASTASAGGADTQLTARFVTQLGEELRVPDAPVSLPASLTRYGLSQIVNHLLSLDPPRPFDFLVDGELVRTPLHQLLLSKAISAESVLTIEYLPAVVPPTSKQQCPHDDWVTAVAGTADGEAVTGSGDGLLRRWALGGADGEPSCSGALLAHPGGVTSLASASTAASGQLLYSAGKDRVLRLWRPADGGFGQPVATFKGHMDAVQCVAAAPGAQQLASCGWDGVVRLWRGADVVVAASDDAGPVKSAKKGGKRRRGAAGEGAEAPADGATEESWGSLEGHSQCATAVHWLDTTHLVSGSWDHSVRVWDSATCGPVSTLHAPKAVHSVAALSEGAVVFGSSDSVLRVWDPRGRGESLNLRGFASHSGWITALAGSKTSPHHFMSTSFDATVKLWDLRAAVPLATITGHSDKVICGAWLDGDRAASGGADCSLHVHNVFVTAGA